MIRRGTSMKPELLDDLIMLCKELMEQEEHILPLCAAENVMSPFSKIPLDTFLQEKYIMGGVAKYHDNNNFIGSDKLYYIYDLLNRQCTRLYRSKYADARTLSGVNAVTTLLMSLFVSGDTILISSEDCGGHGSMPKICNRLGIRTEELPYDYNSFDFDYEKINQVLCNKNIKGILVCLSDIIQMPQLNKFDLPPDCTLIFDATQILGLIAANKLPNPLDWYTDTDNFILMGATHKTLAGPTCGLIMTKNLTLANKFDTLINPDYLRNNQLHHILSLILSLMELEVYGSEYADTIVNNANALGSNLSAHNFNVLKANSTYTCTHQLFVSMPFQQAQSFYNKCATYGVSLNLRNKPLYHMCGIRIGTQQVSRYKWKEDKMQSIAQILADIYNDTSNPDDIHDRINSLSRNKEIGYTFDQLMYETVFSCLHNG